MLMSPFLIVGTQGLTVTPHNWQATKGMPDMPVGLRLQKVATGVVVEIMGALIPDIMKPWLSASAANFSTARTPPLRVAEASCKRDLGSLGGG